MRTDILLKNLGNNFFDFEIRDGDIVTGNSDVQHQTFILLAYPGTFKQHPKIGVGIMKHLNTSYSEEVAREIAIHFKSDGYLNVDVDFQNDKLLINEIKR